MSLLRSSLIQDRTLTYVSEILKLSAGSWVGRRHLIITTPNPQRYLQYDLETQKGCEIVEGDWSIPDALRPITEAEKELIYAQHRVEADRTA